MATTVAGSPTYFESDGKAVNVTLTDGDVVKGAVPVVNGWLGIAGEDADSGVHALHERAGQVPCDAARRHQARRAGRDVDRHVARAPH